MAAAAFEAALVATVQPHVISANRNAFVQLVLSNLLGQNAPAIAAAEAHYEQMWAQDVSAMYGYYSGASAAAEALTPFAQIQGLLGGGAPAANSAASGIGGIVVRNFRNLGLSNFGEGNIGNANIGHFNFGSGNQGSNNFGSGNVGSGNTGFGNAGPALTAALGNFGFGNTGSGNIGFGNTGNNNIGFGNTGNTEPRYRPDRRLQGGDRRLELGLDGVAQQQRSQPHPVRHGAVDQRGFRGCQTTSAVLLGTTATSRRWLARNIASSSAISRSLDCSAST